LRLQAPSLGFLAPSRHNRRSLRSRSLTFARHRAAGIPSPLRSVLDVSHVLDGLLLHRRRGLISSRSHVRASLFRGFPSQEAVQARRLPLPSGRLCWLAAPQFYPMGSTNQHPPPGPCSSCESVANRGGLDLDPPAPLLSFSFLGFFFANLESTFTLSPAMAFLSLRRVEDPRPALLLRARLPVQGS